MKGLIFEFFVDNISVMVNFQKSDSLNCNSCNLLPIQVGIGPDNLFSPASSITKFVQLLKESGMSLVKSSWTTIEIVPLAHRNEKESENLFVDRSRAANPLRNDGIDTASWRNFQVEEGLNPPANSTEDLSNSNEKESQTDLEYFRQKHKMTDQEISSL
ncbi:hypothetical protein CR513_42764, partial [Mucuna pruriens]